MEIHYEVDFHLFLIHGFHLDNLIDFNVEFSRSITKSLDKYEKIEILKLFKFVNFL